MRSKRRWRDGPRWSWLCYVLGHQHESWKWYSWCGLSPSWHYHGTTTYGVDSICERCRKGLSFTSKL